MDGPEDCYTKWNKSEKDKYRMYPLYVKSKKKPKDTSKLIYKIETDSQS